MALEGYYNLKEKKKKFILDAILLCLKKKDYDQLSINDISVEADISRGSFYNYFVDKNDAVSTLIISKLNGFKDMFKETVINNSGKLFDSVLEVNSKIKNMEKNDIYVATIRNLRFISSIGMKIILSEEYEDEFNGLIDWMIENTIEGKKYITDRHMMGNVAVMIIGLILNSISESIFNFYGRKVVYNDFELKLQMIKCGVENGLKNNLK